MAWRSCRDSSGGCTNIQVLALTAQRVCSLWGKGLPDSLAARPKEHCRTPKGSRALHPTTLPSPGPQQPELARQPRASSLLPAPWGTPISRVHLPRQGPWAPQVLQGWPRLCSGGQGSPADSALPCSNKVYLWKAMFSVRQTLEKVLKELHIQL